MPDILFIDTIKVERRSKTGTQANGEPIYTFSIVYASLPARIEYQNSALQYKTAGQRPMYDLKVYTPPLSSGVEVLILEEDKVTKTTGGGNKYLGLVKDILTATRATDTLVDHFELGIEEP